MARSDVPRTVGRYVLFGELASGGMATVHFGRLAGPVGFSRMVAIKKLHPHFAKDPEFVSMFLDEARLCGRIRHPNVVPTLDVVTNDGEVLIVMEYVAGEALSKLLKTAWARGLPVPPRVVATILSSVLHGLHAAHRTKDEHGRELGIVHRDVSPQNILVGADGGTRVLDFGVAKAAGRVQTTRDGQVKGKIAYMPPEQLAGASVTPQTDIYAAAVVLWEALAGRRLFDGETEALVLVRAIEGRIEPPSRFSPELGPAVDALVLRGLARDPSVRFPTARDFALAIEQTIGLASPSQVGEWVELVAHDELARRAARIAEIEQASLDLGSAAPTRVALPVPEPPHSQVSSISVARSAVAAPGAASRRGGRIFGLLAATLALSGFALGAIAVQERLAGPTPRGEPHVVATEARSLSVAAPETAPAKLTFTDLSPPARPAPAPPPAPVHVAPRPHASPPPAPKTSCDPPYTTDPATGRRKYKIECLGPN